MPALQQEALTFKEIPQQALRDLLKRTKSPRRAVGDACGGGCGHGADCRTRSEEMEQMLCGAD
jgi:hypothetical protein